MKYYVKLFLAFTLSFLLKAPIMGQDALPCPARADSGHSVLLPQQLPEHTPVADAVPIAELTQENLLAALEKYEVKFPKIVLAQAILETGYFTSALCMEAHNLFGLRHPSDGSYYTFDNWEQSVKAYHDDVQYKYSGGDYYAFLRRIGYAEDPRYTVKVRKIADTL